MLNPEKKFDVAILQIYLPHLQDVATLPWEIQKSHFQQHYSYNLLTIYVISKQTVIHLPTPPKNVTTLTCVLQNLFI